MKMYQITVESINKFNRIEWSETVEAKSKAAATRKANKIIKSTGEEANTHKHTNEFDSKMEIWQLKF
jgi:phage regulator Rha-like protein